MYFVYILFSPVSNRFYIGQTADIADRINRHNAGYELATKAYRPWQMILSLEKSTRSEALILERKLKNLNTSDLRRFIEKYRR
jgi:putative endonuclease